MEEVIPSGALRLRRHLQAIDIFKIMTGGGTHLRRENPHKNTNKNKKLGKQLFGGEMLMVLSS